MEEGPALLSWLQEEETKKDLEKENSVAGSVQTLFLRIVAQVREGAQLGQMWG